MSWNSFLFVLSKVFWLFTKIDNVLLFLFGLGLLGLRTRFVKESKKLLTSVFLIFAAISLLPVDQWILRPLENRYSPPNLINLKVDGVIVLGGAIDLEVSGNRERPELNAAADRVTTMLSLLRKFPNAKIVFTSGSGIVLDQTHREADVVATLAKELGVEAEKMIFERDSRNTYENAVASKRLIQPKSGENWLLVTSAFHMPRSVGIFKKIGWDVIPYPVDYRTRKSGFFLHDGFSSTIENINIGLKEWVGLISYRILGRL